MKQFHSPHYDAFDSLALSKHDRESSPLRAILRRIKHARLRQVATRLHALARSLTTSLSGTLLAAYRQQIERQSQGSSSLLNQSFNILAPPLAQVLRGVAPLPPFPVNYADRRCLSSVSSYLLSFAVFAERNQEDLNCHRCNVTLSYM